MKKSIAIAALAVAALAGPARAQDASPARLRAAGELLQAGDMQRNYERTLDLTMEQQKRANPEVGRLEPQMRDFLARYLSWSQVEAEFARIYAQMYTEDELHQLAAFYRTPLGRRVLETQPELAARSAEVSQRLLAEHLPELTQMALQAARVPARASGGSRGTPKKP